MALLVFLSYLTMLQDVFHRLKKFKIVLRYSRSKSENTTGSLWEARTKKAKIGCFTKNYFILRSLR